MKKKAIIVVLLITLTATMFAGCGKKKAEGEGYFSIPYKPSIVEKRSESVTTTDVLLAMANAYELKGIQFQYDQKWMDQLNKDYKTRHSRWDNTATPEAATSQVWKYTDCSKFQYACYYNAFGYELPALATDTMLDFPELQVFYCEPTGEETEEEEKAVLDELQKILQPGDLISYRMLDNTNGHIMMYVGDGILVHATGANGGDYQYTGESKKTDIQEDSGAIGELNIKTLLDYTNYNRYLMGQLKFGVLRPLKDIKAEDITDDAYCRTLFMQGIISEATTNLPLSYSVEVGEEITYTLSFENRDVVERKIHLDIEEPENMTIESPVESEDVTVEPGAKVSTSFTVKVKGDDALYGKEIEGPKVKANGMTIKTYGYTVNRNLTGQQAEALAKVDFEKAEVTDDFSMIKYAFKEAMDYDIPASSMEEFFRGVFYRDDYNNATVTPTRKGALGNMLVDYLYGGMSVKYDQLSYGKYATALNIQDIRQGDILFISEDFTGKNTYAYLCVAPGKFAKYYKEDKKVSVIPAGYMNDVMPALLGQACYAVLRPSYAMNEKYETEDSGLEPVTASTTDMVIPISQIKYGEPDSIDVYSVETGKKYKVKIENSTCLESGRLYSMKINGGLAEFETPKVTGLFDGNKESSIMCVAAEKFDGKTLSWATDGGKGSATATSSTKFTEVSNPDYYANMRDPKTVETITLSKNTQKANIECNVIFAVDSEGNLKWVISEKEGYGINRAVGYPRPIYVQ